MKRLGFAMLCLFCTLGCEGTRGPTTPPPSTAREIKADAPRDNTGLNVRDRDETAKTPIDQNENQKDVTMTADIRKKVVGAKMSTYASNVKIITADGHVTLRGPVKSDDEKMRIGEIAEKIAGSENVDNQLEVAGDN